MSRFINSGTVAVAGALALVVAGTTSLLAEGVQVPPVAHQATKKECAACHMLYPPALLPARSWRALMGNLKDHFGDNAELDDATTKAIADYLADNAGDTRRGASKITRRLDAKLTPERITDLPWWKRKHEKKDRVSAATLKRKGAKFKGDCKACHKEAELGVFEEDD